MSDTAGPSEQADYHPDDALEDTLGVMAGLNMSSSGGKAPVKKEENKPSEQNTSNPGDQTNTQKTDEQKQADSADKGKPNETAGEVQNDAQKDTKGGATGMDESSKNNEQKTPQDNKKSEEKPPNPAGQTKSQSTNQKTGDKTPADSSNKDGQKQEEDFDLADEIQDTIHNFGSFFDMSSGGDGDKKDEQKNKDKKEQNKKDHKDENKKDNQDKKGDTNNGSGTTGDTDSAEMAKLKARSDYEQILAAFQTFDKDKSGTISREELKAILGDGFEDKFLEEFFESLDANGDGVLKINEMTDVLVNTYQV